MIGTGTDIHQAKAARLVTGLFGETNQHLGGPPSIFLSPVSKPAAAPTSPAVAHTEVRYCSAVVTASINFCNDTALKCTHWQWMLRKMGVGTQTELTVLAISPGENFAIVG
jgi:hypothetical protein